MYFFADNLLKSKYCAHSWAGWRVVKLEVEQILGLSILLYAWMAIWSALNFPVMWDGGRLLLSHRFSVCKHLGCVLAVGACTDVNDLVASGWETAETSSPVLLPSLLWAVVLDGYCDCAFSFPRPGDGSSFSSFGFWNIFLNLLLKP